MQLAFQPNSKGKDLKPPTLPSKDLSTRYDRLQVYVDQYNKMMKSHVETVKACIQQANAFEKLKDKIERLDESLMRHSVDFAANDCDEVAIPGLIQLVRWCMSLWQSKAPKGKTSLKYATTLFHVASDTFRRLHPRLSVEEFGVILSSFHSLGLKRMKERERGSVQVLRTSDK